MQGFHPAVQGWFEQKFSSATPVQQGAWPAITRHEHTLLTAPTGSGKTLAAFLASINQLVVEGLSQPLPDESRILYISPLKALSNDIQINLQEPLDGIENELEKMGLPKIGIKAWVRTGDTPASERQKMAKTPPHIIVTTPETAYLLLTSKSGRNMLKTIDTVIVDEIHALIDNKRGAHLSLTLERLAMLSNKRITRIGCSATQKPIDTVANFLLGARDEPCSIIDTGHQRERDLQLELPSSPLDALMSNEVWTEVYDRLAELVEAHNTTLIFVNTRRLAERAAKHLSDRLGEEAVTSHHGSLAKEHRQKAEQALKNGQLKCLVATASLELGIDIGDVNLVCQLGSPKSINSLLQRVGRSGHHIYATPKGRLFPLSRDDLVECIALLKAIQEENLDQLVVKKAPLDVLAQQIVAELAGREAIAVDELYKAFIIAWPYKDLSLDEFKKIIDMLSAGYSTRRGRRASHLHYDAVNQQIRAKKGSGLIAMTNGGTIPDQFDYDVILQPEDLKIGTLNEDFSFESMPGDIFQLGNNSYRILKVEQRRGQVLVADAKGEPPNLPFWFGEAPGRSDVLSRVVSELRIDIENDLSVSYETAEENLQKRYGLSKSACEQVLNYLSAAKDSLGVLPSQEHIVIERFFDDTGDMHYVIHSPFGSRINRAWGLALRKKFCRRFNFELQAAALEDTIILSLSVTHSFPITEPLSYVKSEQARETLIQAMLDAPMFPNHWRWVATTALAVKRNHNGKKAPAFFQRNDAEDLIALLFPDQIACAENITGLRQIPDHPLVTQTINDCLHEVMDIDGFEAILRRLEAQTLKISAKDLSTPSPLAQEVITARPYAFLDDAPAEERRVLAIKSQNYLNPNTIKNDGIIAPEAIAKVRAEAWPQPDSADELHDALCLLGYLLADEGQMQNLHGLFKKLCESQRATSLTVAGKILWVAAERLHEFSLITPIENRIPNIAAYTTEAQEAMTADDAIRELIRSRLEGLGPVTADRFAAELGRSPAEIEFALIALENEGFVVRGEFDKNLAENQWCERRLLARMHRYTIKTLRAEAKTVSPQQFMAFLFAWQGLSEQGSGSETLALRLKQLEGYAAPAFAWEQEILPSRINLYTSHLLDQLCQSGLITWYRPPITTTQGSERRSNLVKRSPIMLVLRRHLPRWHKGTPALDSLSLSSTAQRVLEVFNELGPCFYQDLVECSGLLKSQLEDALGELVNHGLVSSDNFEGLRALMRPQKQRSKFKRRRFSQDEFDFAGRWSLLRIRPKLEDRNEHVARTLLNRYGFVFKQLLAKEQGLPPWRELLQVYWRLEARGEIRGGRFVQGFSGEQFALPEALTLLDNQQKHGQAESLITISSQDPLNLVGTILPGDKLGTSNSRLLFKQGRLLAIQNEQGTQVLDNSQKENAIDIAMVLKTSHFRHQVG